MRYALLFTLVLAVLLPLGLIGCGGGDTEAPSALEQSESDPAAAAGDRQDLAYVTADFYAALIVHPKRLAENPLVAPLLKQPVVADAINKAGVHLAKIERLTILMATETRYLSENPLFVVRFTEPVDGQAVLLKLMKLDRPNADLKPREVKLDGKICFAPSSGPEPLVYQADDRTMILGNRGPLKKLIVSSEPGGPLADRLRQADRENDLIAAIALEPVQEVVDLVVADIKKDPNYPAAPYARLATKTRGATLTLNLAGDPLVRVVVDANEAAVAEEIESAAKQGLQKGRKAMADRISEIPEMLKEQLGPAPELLQQAVDGIRVERSQEQVALTVKRPAGMEAAAAKAVAMLDESAGGVKKSAGQSQAMNSLKQISTAVLVYEATKKCFPPAVLAHKSTGKPMWSWRVALLPYLDQKALFDEFHRGEPWDSPHNLEVARRQMPRVYRSEGLEPGMTRIVVFTGKGAAFDGTKLVTRALIKDGTTNTIMLVEAGPDKAVFWTKPEDLPFDSDNVLAVLGKIEPPGVAAAFFDGHCETVQPDAARLKALITPAGGERTER